MSINTNKCLDWLQASTLLKKFKKKELSLRNEIISEHGSTKIDGTEKQTIDNLEIIFSFDLTKSIDRAALDTGWDNLSEEEKACIDWKPALKLKEYKALKESNPKSLLLRCITEKPAQGTLKMVYLDEQ